MSSSGCRRVGGARADRRHPSARPTDDLSAAGDSASGACRPLPAAAAIGQPTDSVSNANPPGATTATPATVPTRPDSGPSRAVSSAAAVHPHPSRPCAAGRRRDRPRCRQPPRPPAPWRGVGTPGQPSLQSTAIRRTGAGSGGPVPVTRGRGRSPTAQPHRRRRRRAADRPAPRPRPGKGSGAQARPRRPTRCRPWPWCPAW